MVHQVKVANSGRTFAVHEDESILDAALRAGIRIRYGCRRGKCATCKHWVLEGEVDDSEVSRYALLDDEREDGLTLLCQTYALSDCVVELVELGGDDDDTAAPLPTARNAWLGDLAQVATSLWSLTLELDEPMAFLPGQYIEIEVPGAPGTTRSYSIASPPSQTQRIDLLLKRYEHGAFSGQLTALAPAAPMRLEGPFGEMYLRDSDRSVLLVGTGSGLAPLLGIARHLADVDPTRGVRLVYGARDESEVPFTRELERLSHVMEDLQVTITLTQPTSTWTGPTGRVQGLLARNFEDGRDLDAYICGPPDMCDDVQLFLEARGVKPSHIHTDGFFAADDDGNGS
ncbi:MAG: 2Fe-2S iron-sulfur cluster-binding protein [Acidimicrobiales bacterium]|nr:2Fe-2S iron-sulfur cluster-binding protein [Acidimicrobiales bacterium]